MSATLLRSATYDRPSATSLSSTTSYRPSRRAVITGRILPGIVAVLLTLDAGIKLVRAKAAVEGSAQLGFTPDQVFVIGRPRRVAPAFDQPARNVAVDVQRAPRVASQLVERTGEQRLPRGGPDAIADRFDREHALGEPP